MEAAILLQQVANGLVICSIYAMVALGLTLIFGILHIGNFAHGQLYMLGAFATYWLVSLWGWNIWSSMFVAMALMALLGMVLERIVFRPVRSAPHINGLIVALGLFIALENIAFILWGGDERTLPSPYATKMITILSISPRPWLHPHDHRRRPGCFGARLPRWCRSPTTALAGGVAAEQGGQGLPHPSSVALRRVDWHRTGRFSWSANLQRPR
jgi:hypothetical protein